MTVFPSDPYRMGAANRDLEEEALGWIVRLSSGDTTGEELAEFTEWHRDPDNAGAYCRAMKLWEGVGPVLQKQEAAGWPAEAPPAQVTADTSAPTRSNFAKRRWYLAAAASIACLSTAAGVRYVWWGQYDDVSGSAIRAGVALPDGSQLAMAPNTAIKSDFANGARHVSLARGEAYFDVRHDAAHPFVVSSGDGVVRVLGTAFTVRHQDNGGVVVTVTRGLVQVTSGAHTVLLAPNRQVRFDMTGLGQVRAVDSSITTAWMRGRLIMENRPLGEILAELDRYDRGSIFILNPEAAQRRINAVIDLRRTDGFLTALASSQGLTLTRLGPVKILR